MKKSANFANTCMIAAGTRAKVRSKKQEQPQILRPRLAKERPNNAQDDSSFIE
jgi:hypothetical protein